MDALRIQYSPTRTSCVVLVLVLVLVIVIVKAHDTRFLEQPFHRFN
jgi:hypothetical protein